LIRDPDYPKIRIVRRHAKTMSFPTAALDSLAPPGLSLTKWLHAIFNPFPTAQAPETAPLWGSGPNASGSGGRLSFHQPKPSVHPMSYHVPVLLNEVIYFLRPEPGRRIVDGTLGGGGHSYAMLDHGATVIGFDRDPDALEAARQRCEEFGDWFVALHGNFADIADILTEIGFGQVDGVLLDLGVSSHQIDTAGRGFSFQADGPLDMRMDTTGPRTAADIVNHSSEQELKRIFRDLGEEQAAGKIARAIMDAIRGGAHFETTLDLARLVEKVQPRRGRIHPATKVFQALRMEVNEELQSLYKGLESATAKLRPGGRLAVITFHSLEDRIVKNYLRDRSQPTIDRPEWPAPRPNPDYAYKLLTRKPVIPSAEEIAANPRARSAKLRIAERVDPTIK